MTDVVQNRSTLSYLRWALISTVVGLALGALLGWFSTGTIAGMLSVFFICAVLAVLEISLSFDNAVVNANKLKTMTPVWQQRFLTWGILIAVFGMRIVFPLAIVVVAAGIGPIAAIDLAITKPAEYAEIMHDAHLGISAFGGSFLLMVALAYFFDPAKEIHWADRIERVFASTADIRGAEVAFVTLMILVFSVILGEKGSEFMTAALWGLFTFLVVDLSRHMLDRADKAMEEAARGGLGAFLYLEVLDASFSFDGVIGAFALTNNLFIIAIGLGIGAMYVRAMTIMLVEKRTLAEYRYLEHGAFYAIFFLGLVMYVKTVMHVPEVVTGLGGATLIGFALWSSIRHNRRAIEA